MSDSKDQSGSILIVEDEFLVRTAAEEYLGNIGFRTFSACDVDTAVALLETSEGIDILFSDIKLPSGRTFTDGQDLALFARARWPSMEIVLTSGFTASDTVRLPTRSVFLPKPYDLDRVAHILKTMRVPGRGTISKR